MTNCVPALYVADMSGRESPFPETPLPKPIEFTEQGKPDNSICIVLYDPSEWILVSTYEGT